MDVVWLCWTFIDAVPAAGVTVGMQLPASALSRLPWLRIVVPPALSVCREPPCRSVTRWQLRAPSRSCCGPRTPGWRPAVGQSSSAPLAPSVSTTIRRAGGDGSWWSLPSWCRSWLTGSTGPRASGCRRLWGGSLWGFPPQVRRLACWK
jgi:hypothetical protein